MAGSNACSARLNEPWLCYYQGNSGGSVKRVEKMFVFVEVIVLVVNEPKFSL
jgi:hypothetical protein